MTETTFHRALLVVALLGLAAGATAYLVFDQATEAGWLWSAATVPVVLALAVSIIRDFLLGRVGVDAIALVSMSAAIALGNRLLGWLSRSCIRAETCWRISHAEGPSGI